MTRSLVEASRYVSSVDLIDLDALAAKGVRALLLDRDNTCIPRDTHVAPPEVRAWLAHARGLGMACCLLSNNFHGEAVAADACDLGCQVVDHAMKPAPFAVWVALAKVGVPAEQAVLIGDQVFTDVLAGNLAGLATILVRPQSTCDLWYTQAFRVGERLALSGVRFEGE
ncbi:MAG: YqeG family HAD IIIA-type phosphatase [Atopobiaceae bacterium]|nr:YqeG family HAD IIIA-type phosphatase [Atopobiaceae bacterium]MCH4180447.1 YqeG family HAD IIIA-type phosphatase [Atopobiaceae bacterium]MCH4214598.1 YqeG family HAD IIIA-type phosphatase [Atopobiaceae bacterium]MCH4230404.1 YqeG family HAD IIIA-type phosphatase [Atopobiaceae bacterium]MCH4275807.1 YqeG family HAD IIIA-type phosphatase [Atopobiaceae bacterium]